MKKISSRDNPLFKQLKALLASGRERRKQGLVVLDGSHLVEVCLAAGRIPHLLVVDESALEKAEILALIARSGIEPALFSGALMREVSTVDTPSGILAAIEPPQPGVLTQGDWVVLDDVQDAGNVGTILRTAAAAGIRDVLLSGGCAQPWSPKVLRAGMGAHFALNIHELADLPGTLASFPGQRLATALGADCCLYQCNLAGPVAWLFGNEGAGLSAEVLACASQRVHIPIAAQIESLNVASAAAICLFEQVRQRWPNQSR